MPAATIHHYLRLGLLPPPRRESANRFAYDERHVQGLKLIRLLRERRRLPLQAIRKILPGLLALEDQAFRPEIWDRAVGLHLRDLTRRSPEARLLEAAKEAFARHGFGEVNIDDICRSARIAKASFYRHYRSKEDLFLAAAESAASDVATECASAISDGPVGFSEAADRLTDALRPGLPIFLELFSRSLQRRPGHRRAARRVVTILAGGLMALVATEGDPAPVVRRAVERIFAHILDTGPLEAHGAATRA